MQHWGNKIENPYTVQNMCRAYDELMNCSGSTIAKYGFSKKSNYYYTSLFEIYSKEYGRTENSKIFLLEKSLLINLIIQQQ